MLYAKHYHIDPKYQNFLEHQGIQIDSEFYDTDKVDVSEAEGCARGLEELFPGYLKMIKGPKEKVYKVFDGEGDSKSGVLADKSFTKGKVFTTIEADDYDLILTTGWPFLDEDFNIELLKKYEKFGFSRPIEFVMTLSALKSRELLQQDKRQVEWEVNGTRTTITADIHGDTQIEQHSTKRQVVLSPYGEVVPFKPLKNKLLRAWYHSESRLMSVFLGYLNNAGLLEESFGEKFINLKNLLEDEGEQYGNFGNAGDICPMRLGEVYDMFSTPISNIHGDSYHYVGANPSTAPGADPYYFYIGDNGNLEVYEGVRGNQKALMTFSPDDAKQAVAGLLNGARNGIGRTGIGELTELINLVIHGEDYMSEIARKY